MEPQLTPQGHDPNLMDLFFFYNSSVTHRPQTVPPGCVLYKSTEAFPVHRCALCAKRMVTIKRDGEPEVRKGKEMYKQRERTRDKASDQEIAKAAAARDVLSPGPVRHRPGSEGCET